MGRFLPLNPGATDPSVGAGGGASLLKRGISNPSRCTKSGRFVCGRAVGPGQGARSWWTETARDRGVEREHGARAEDGPGRAVGVRGLRGAPGDVVLVAALALAGVGEEEGLRESGAALLHVGGRSNRAKEEFKSELNDILDEMPEYLS